MHATSSSPGPLPRLPERRRLAPWQRYGSWLLASLCLVGCGGGSEGGGPSEPIAPGVVEPLAGPAVRVEVSPVALLLTDNGQQQRLSVRAFDQDDREVKTAVTWEALRPAQVGVAADGTVRANTAVGSGQVVAIVDGVRSAPVVVSVVQLAPGVTLINDAQIGSVPVAVDPLAEPDTDNPYEVLLTGIAAPAPGTLLLGREGQVIGGEVIESRVEAGGVRVRLKTVAIDRLVVAAEIQEEIDLKGLPLQVPPDIAALYDVRLEADEYIFTPRPGIAATSQPVAASVSPGQPGQPGQKRALATTDGRKGALALREFFLGPFKCEVATPELPLSLTQPAQFSLKFVPGYLVDYSRATGLKRLLFKAEASFKMKANLQVNAGGLLNLTCESTLLQRLVPLPGVAGLLLGGELKAGVGIETEGSIAIPLLGAELVAEAKGSMEAGLDCTTGTCRVHSQWKPETSNTLRFITPGDALANARSEFFLFGYGFAKLRAGLTLVSGARVDVVTVRGGLKFETSLAPEATQLAPVEAGQPDYRSDYKVQGLGEVAAGSVNKGDSGLRKLLQKLGVFKVTLLKVQLSLPLGGSPKGSATVDNGDVARDGAFVDGQRLGFRVKLDPPTASFPLLGYNVRRVRILFTAEGLLPREVASVEAQPGQTEFDLSWLAEGTAGATGRGFSAFVDTVLPVPVGLEIGHASLAPKQLSGTVKISYTRTEDSFNGVASRSRLVDTVSIEGRAAESAQSPGVFEISEVQGSHLMDFSGSNSIPRVISGCSLVQNFAGSQQVSELPVARPRLNLTIGADNRWLLANVSSDFKGTSTTIESFNAGNASGAGCASLDLSPTLKTTTNDIETSVFTPNFREPLDPGTRAWLSGPLTIDPATGRRSIVARLEGSGTLPSGNPRDTFTRSYSVALNLTEEPPPGKVDLAIRLDGKPLVTPQGAMTYAVNLSNQGAQAATEVRAEFNLPVGWKLVSTSGWSGCTVVLSSVACRTDRMEPGERKAFLVDVTAPEAFGQYTASARVSAAELDTDFSNNLAETTSTLVE